MNRSRNEILITKRGKPIARLLPADPGIPPLFGRMKGSAEVCGDLVDPVDERWSADE